MHACIPAHYFVNMSCVNSYNKKRLLKDQINKCSYHFNSIQGSCNNVDSNLPAKIFCFFCVLTFHPILFAILSLCLSNWNHSIYLSNRRDAISNGPLSSLNVHAHIHASNIPNFYIGISYGHCSMHYSQNDSIYWHYMKRIECSAVMRFRLCYHFVFKSI